LVTESNIKCSRLVQKHVALASPHLMIDTRMYAAASLRLKSFNNNNPCEATSHLRTTASLVQYILCADALTDKVFKTKHKTSGQGCLQCVTNCRYLTLNVVS
jgi:hypothetical protein